MGTGREELRKKEKASSAYIFVGGLSLNGLTKKQVQEK